MRGHTVQRGQTWTYWVDVGRDESGKRKQLTKGGFKTKREAQVSLNQVLSKLDEHSRAGAAGRATREGLLVPFVDQRSPLATPDE